MPFDPHTVTLAQASAAIEAGDTSPDALLDAALARIEATDSDLNAFVRLMERTADRPLPAGRMSPDVALGFGLAMAAGGLALLAVASNLLSSLLGLVALVGYVLVYTPLKRLTSLATVVGAVPGAIPPMMGWVAASEVSRLSGV